MPTSRRQKASAKGIAAVSSPTRVHPAVAHPSSPPAKPKVQIRAGKFGTVRAFPGPTPKGR
jgi:hypothetical protein